MLEFEGQIQLLKMNDFFRIRSCFALGSAANTA